MSFNLVSQQRLLQVRAHARTKRAAYSSPNNGIFSKFSSVRNMRKSVIEELKRMEIYQIVSENLFYTYSEMEALVSLLENQTIVHDWRIEQVVDPLFEGAVIYGKYKNTNPAIILRLSDGCFVFSSIVFDFKKRPKIHVH